MGLDDETKFKLLSSIPEYNKAFYEFINPKTFITNANFKIYKREETKKIFKVRIKLEKNHIPILEELKKEKENVDKDFYSKHYIEISKNHFF